MKLRLKLGSVLVCLMFLTGCSMAMELVAPVTNFGLGLYNADTYYSKECAWYEPVWFSKETKQWIADNIPKKEVVKDFAKVARNNDLYKEVCEK